mmetsp:Transcript_18123/g.53956  ORF Transcript_18123/g.53956 Transcript_18123/m.53956 type:complete len:136 (-) Transcript_18123:732-1139(-)
MTNADLNTLALGSDLTTLGLNLNSSECLYSTFASPWAEAPITREPQFSLPLCYYMQPPPLKTSHLSKFQLETLFYIFYAMPKDVSNLRRVNKQNGSRIGSSGLCCTRAVQSRMAVSSGFETLVQAQFFCRWTQFL